MQRHSNLEVLSGNTGTSSPLARVFVGSDGGAYYVTEVGNEVFWFAEHPGRDYAHVFHGTRDGDRIEGEFLSVPKDRVTSRGRVMLRVQQNGSLALLSQEGGFPAKWLNVTSIHGIVDQLPGKASWPGFTANSLDDLDGVFADGQGRRCYVRQLGDDVVIFGEEDFAKGEQPGVALVFVGTRQGSMVTGKWAAVPKGTQTGNGSLALTVDPSRKLHIPAGFSFGGGNTFLPVLPPIRVPISKVMKLANAVLGEIQIRLDGYAGDGSQPLVDGSYVKLGDEAVHFTMPYHDYLLSRYFINDMTSDIIVTKPISENETRLSVVFEDKERELKRVSRSGHDGLRKDWDIEGCRCDVHFKLVSHKTSKGGDSISYEVTKVNLLAEVDAPLLIEAIDDFITKKVRPMVTSAVLEVLNRPSSRLLVADRMQDMLDALVAATDEFDRNGYGLSKLIPKNITIDGNDVVFHFI